MCIVCQARAQKPEFCGCHCDSTDSTGDENNTAKVASCCECAAWEADCAGCVCLCGGKKEGLSAHLKHFQKTYCTLPTSYPTHYFFTYLFTFIFHFTPSCFFVWFTAFVLFITWNLRVGSFLRISQFNTSNSMVDLQITRFTVWTSHAREAGVFTRAKPL